MFLQSQFHTTQRQLQKLIIDDNESVVCVYEQSEHTQNRTREEKTLFLRSRNWLRVNVDVSPVMKYTT